MRGLQGIKHMMYRDPTLDIEQMQSAMTHPYLDSLSRVDGIKGAIAGRGTTMTTETSTSDKCGKKTHYPRNCTDKNSSTSTKSVMEILTHSQVDL